MMIESDLYSDIEGFKAETLMNRINFIELI